MPTQGLSKTLSSLLPPVLLAVIAFGLQANWASSRESQIWDEAYAIAIGHLQVKQGTFGVLPESLPLLGLLTWAPLAAVDAKLPPAPPDFRKPATIPRFGSDFFYRMGNDHRALLTSARSAVLALSLAAVAVLVVWAFRLHGPAGAWLAACLCAFEPNWLTHGHLAAWDGIGTSTLVFAAFASSLFLERPTYGRAVLAGVFTGIAWIAKYTTLLLWPCLLAMFLYTAIVNRRRRDPPATDSGPLSPGGLVARYGLLVFVGLLVVGASYNGSFRYDLYVGGAGDLFSLGRPAYDNYFLGEFRQQNFPLYYVAGLLAKTPVGFLPLLPLGLVACLRRNAAERLLLVLLPPGLLLLVTAFNPWNLGIRHVVPAIPFLILVASGAATLFAGHRLNRLLVILVACLAIGGAAESLARAPRYLSFFNVAVGGPENGIRILDDSAIDWGQGLVELAEVQQREEIEELALFYHGSADPAAYGVRSRPVGRKEFFAPRQGVTYAISIHTLNRLPHSYGPSVRWLEQYRPWRRAGDSIYLYRF